MVGRLPSLGLILELVQGEREKQLAHFDALDAKAGIVLGFAGVLIALAPDVSVVFRALGLLASTLAATFALWSFWPRRFPVLEPSPLRTYLRAEKAFTQLTVVDTLEDLVNEGSRILRDKGRRLQWALVALVSGAFFFAAGILLDSF